MSTLVDMERVALHPWLRREVAKVCFDSTIFVTLLFDCNNKAEAVLILSSGTWQACYKTLRLKHSCQVIPDKAVKTFNKK